MSRRIFIYDNDKGKVVEVKKEPPKPNNTKDHVNMRTTWSSQTKVEFNAITMEESFKSMGIED
tara:strand:- start:125 stop:313 length:189 start_codon:yes stop_codon:yes gene_type:complete